MKRFSIAIHMILLLAILSSCLPLHAQLTNTPHENPVTAKDSPELASLLLFHVNLFELIAIKQYQDAEGMLNTLEYANIPDELLYLIDHYRSMSKQLISTLDNLQAIFDEVPSLLSRNQTDEVKQKLDDAEAAINSAQMLLTDIMAATKTIGVRTGVLAAPASSQARLAYDNLEQILQRLMRLTNELSQLKQSLAEKRKAKVEELIPTELSLNVAPELVFVGDSITAQGRLIGNGVPIPGRKVTLLVDDEPLAITTGPDGSYSSSIVIPYKYVSNMSLKTVYIPSGDDIDTYQSSASPKVEVNTSFYTTHLEASAPDTVQPGLPILVSGQISSTPSTFNRTAEVLLDNVQLAEEIVQEQFNIQVTLPQQVSMGKHILTVAIAPQERYSSASKRLTINISTLPIYVDIKVSPLVAIPGSFQIAGKVRHNLDPIQNATVSLNFRDSSIKVKTATDGSFTTAMDAPFNLFLAGPQELIMKIEPTEPWYTSLQVRKQIFIINPVNMGLILITLLSLWLLIFAKIKARSVKPREEQLAYQTKPRGLPTIDSFPKSKYKFAGIKGRIFSAYLDGLKAVEGVTHILMSPHTTLKEFLDAAIPLVPVINRPFTELTKVAEIALYSGHVPDENAAIRAEQLTANIKQELQHGAT
jgi:enamine deaminase RidA (YjgF/YER057c/UK114 family)